SRQTDCPPDVQAFKKVLKQHLALQPAMVANRGRHNPGAGSFSFFEEASGKLPTGDKLEPGSFFFGHFTEARGSEIVLQKEPADGALMIEAIAQDFKTGLYHFYELIGDGVSGQWFYRGSSLDALKDNEYLYRASPPGQPHFGRTMRCSGCHSSGGPIQKEIASPFNDWWTQARPLPFGTLTLSPEVGLVVAGLVETQHFSRSVSQGMQRLEASAEYQKAKQSRSLQEELRPLFCETEINLESDLEPLGGAAKQVRIPSAFYLNPVLGQGEFTVDKARYLQLLKDFKMRFPETQFADADHAWLTPVKAQADLLAIESLIRNGTVDAEWVADVLAVDFESPIFSQSRCALLRLVPADRQNWKRRFESALAGSSLPGAAALLTNFSDSSRDQAFHKAKALAYVQDSQKRLLDPAGQKEAFERLLRAREAVARAEISQNPLGRILEPGFRVIFPIRQGN
ncbi:hypothetical protein K2X33_10665, partial [bacterium]|nr:hypothetical protein [bacterium]